MVLGGLAVSYEPGISLVNTFQHDLEPLKRLLRELNSIAVRPLFLLFYRLYRGTSLIRSSAPLGPCGRAMRRAVWWN